MQPNDNPGSPAPEFLHPDPRQRRVLVLLLVGVFIFTILLYLYGLPALNAWIRTGSTDAMLRKFSVVCYSIAALLLIITATLFGYARRVFRSGQSPPPGTWVLTDTLLRRDADARMVGRIVLVGATCCVLLAIYAIVLPHWLHARLLPPLPVDVAPVISPR